MIGIDLFKNHSYSIGLCIKHNKIFKKHLRNSYIKNVNIDVRQMSFPNLCAQNNPRLVDMLLKSINGNENKLSKYNSIFHSPS